MKRPKKKLVLRKLAEVGIPEGAILLMEIFEDEQEPGVWYVWVDDSRYQVEDAESFRTFSIHECVMMGRDDICLEEI